MLPLHSSSTFASTQDTRTKEDTYFDQLLKVYFCSFFCEKQEGEEIMSVEFRRMGNKEGLDACGSADRHTIGTCSLQALHSGDYTPPPLLASGARTHPM